ncbi:hypothetical protein D3C80_1787780 [compost metagenome]
MLRRRELDAVRDKAHLASLLRDKITHLDQLLTKYLRGRNQRLHRIRGLSHHFLVHFIEYRLQIFALLQCGSRRISLHFCILQLLAQHAKRTVRLAQRLTLGHVILRDANRIDAIHNGTKARIHCLIHLL